MKIQAYSWIKNTSALTPLNYSTAPLFWVPEGLLVDLGCSAPPADICCQNTKQCSPIFIQADSSGAVVNRMEFGIEPDPSNL